MLHVTGADGIVRRCRFALIPIERYSSEFCKNRCYWLRYVIQRKTASGWKAFEADNQ